MTHLIIIMTNISIRHHKLFYQVVVTFQYVKQRKTKASSLSGINVWFLKPPCSAIHWFNSNMLADTCCKMGVGKQLSFCVFQLLLGDMV